MKKIIINTLAVSALLMNTSCKTDFEQDVKDIKISNGEANFSTYVALGNSLTSGFRDGALYRAGQLESYPSMIAQQMKLAGGGEFTQPLMPDDTGGMKSYYVFNSSFMGRAILKVNEQGELDIERLKPISNGEGQSKPYNNMGVPGAKSFDLISENYAKGVGNGGNPFFVRFATSANTSILKDALVQKPTFFSLWIGNNDALLYATIGGAGKNQKGNLDTKKYGRYDITDPQVLENSIKEVLDKLTATGAKGVVANLPSITDIPYFTTIPAKPITGLSEEQVKVINANFAKYNAGLEQAKNLGKITESEYQKRLISFKAGAVANGALIEDEYLTDLSAFRLPSYRLTTSDDAIILTTKTVLGMDAVTGKKPTATSTKINGITVALEDNKVLTANEIKEVKEATEAYNASIKKLADAYGLAFVDANAKMVELKSASGIQWNGVKYTTEFIKGGAFSLDGIHLTGRGYAVMANEFIKAINAKYKSNLPQVNPNNYSGITFP